MSGCRGDVKPYHRRFAERVHTDTSSSIIDGVLPVISLCEVHLAERKREERAKAALEGMGRGRQIAYRELPAKGEAETKCADADRQRLGLPERPPETESYWDDLFRESREKELREIEEVALREEYPDALRLKARASLEVVRNDPDRADWLRKLAAAALERVDKSFYRSKPSRP